MDIGIRQAAPDDLDAVRNLLTTAGLPTAGVEQHFRTFLVAEQHREIVGAIGLEVYDDTALLRSAVVAPGHQRTGVGSRLCHDLLGRAQQLGVHRLILLTNTAEDYFARKGFVRIDQKSVTGPVTTSVEFSGACPAHAACMELIV